MPAASPEKRLRNVLQIAWFDALSLLVIAGPAALVSLVLREWFAAAIGAGIVLCAGLEWSGRQRLTRREATGLAWLCAAQLACLSLILLYANHLARQPVSDHLLSLLPDFTRAQLDELFPDPEALQSLLGAVQRIVAGAVAIAAVLCQGGLAFFYLRSRPAIFAVFQTPPVIATSSLRQ